MDREEALKIVRDLYEKSLFLEKDKEAITTLIPELKDSEDERIRKDIIALIEFGLTEGSAVSPGSHTTKEEALAWLEKQKEREIIIPEPELTEFEKRLSDVVGYAISLSVAEPQKPTSEFVKEYAAELLALAEKEIAKGHEHDVYIPEDTYYEQLAKQWEDGYKKGKAEALKDFPRWKKHEEAANKLATVWNDCDTPWLDWHGHRIAVRDLEKLPGFNED